MHFEILIEDESGKQMLNILMPKIISENDTFKVIGYKGIGRLPKNLTSNSDVKTRILLEQLPRLLKGYGKTFSGYNSTYKATVIVICDLDDKCLKTFRGELFNILNLCNPKPETRFCFAIEEGEAWFLGDINAIELAYPEIKKSVLNNYENDSICGTWELLADAIYSGGSQALSKQEWYIIGAEKSAWAKNISLHMDVENNSSPSFRYFYKKIRELSTVTD